MAGFQLNCYSVSGIDSPPSFRKSITMSARHDDHLGDLDGANELSDQEPHELSGCP